MGPWVFLRCCLSLSLKPCPSPASGLGDPGARPSLVHSASLFSQCHSLPPPKLAWGSDLSSPRTGERKGGARSWRPLPPNTAAAAAAASGKTEERSTGTGIGVPPQARRRLRPVRLRGGPLGWLCVCVGVCGCMCVCGCMWGAHMCLPGELLTGSPREWQLPPAPHLSPGITSWFIIIQLFLDTDPILFDFGVDLVAPLCLFTIGFPIREATGIWLNVTTGRHTL